MLIWGKGLHCVCTSGNRGSIGGQCWNILYCLHVIWLLGALAMSLSGCGVATSGVSAAACSRRCELMGLRSVIGVSCCIYLPQHCSTPALLHVSTPTCNVWPSSMACWWMLVGHGPHIGYLGGSCIAAPPLRLPTRRKRTCLQGEAPGATLSLLFLALLLWVSQTQAQQLGSACGNRGTPVEEAHQVMLV
jgi:hypothetical protein